jgi:hypothetical protein
MQAHGNYRRPEKLYWNAAGEFQGTRAPPCTRAKRTTRKPTQLGLFGEKK